MVPGNQQSLYTFQPSLCDSQLWHSDRQPAHTFRVRAAKGSERAHRGSNRSVVVTLRRRMSRFSYLTGSEARHRVNDAWHKVFFNSHRGNNICLNGMIKARMESLKTHVE